MFELSKTGFEISPRTDRDHVSLARHHAARREGRCGGPARSGFPAPSRPDLPWSSARSPGPRRRGDEPRRQHARARQRGHAARPQGDERASDPQPGARARDERADSLPGPEHLGRDRDPIDDLRLPDADGRRRSHGRLHPNPHRDLLQHDGWTPDHRVRSEDPSSRAGGPGVPGRHEPQRSPDWSPTALACREKCSKRNRPCCPISRSSLS